MMNKLGGVCYKCNNIIRIKNNGCLYKHKLCDGSGSMPIRLEEFPCKVKKIKPSVVLHLAAQSSVLVSYKNSKEVINLCMQPLANKYPKNIYEIRN